jgi:protein-disulfide isomerase
MFFRSIQQKPKLWIDILEGLLHHLSTDKMRRSLMTLFGILSVCFPLFAQREGGEQCPPLAADAQNNIVRYTAQQLRLPDGVGVNVLENTILDGCYRRLKLQGGATNVVLFLAPDQRFVAPSILDTWKDPSELLKADAERVSKLLTAEWSPSRGPAEAPLTIVEFGDFQCPRCRDLTAWINALPANLATRVRIIYKYFPLSVHPLAKSAGGVAACASAQSNGAFGSVHDFFYDHQDSLTGRSLAELGGTVLALSPEALDRYRQCVEAHGGDAAVERDLDLRRRLRVTGTPTLFLNGARVPQPESAEELVALIVAADRKVRDRESDRNGGSH